MIMDLYKEILIEILKYEVARVDFTHIKMNAAEIVDSVSYRALQKIKAIIEDDRLDEKDCFEKIKRIVHVYETIGSSGSHRQNLG